MTANLVCIATALLAGALAQTDSADARGMLIAATAAERALSHGEIVFRYVPDEEERAALEDTLGHTLVDGELKVLYTFRDRQQFRAVLRTGGETLRTIVSDGEFIDMGNGELWDFRFYDDDYGSANQTLDDEFFNLFWTFLQPIERHLFPMTNSYESEYFDDPSVVVEFADDDDPQADTRVIPFQWDLIDDEGTWDRFNVTTIPSYRVTSWIAYYEGESYDVEEWSGITQLDDGRTVMGEYRHSYEELNPEFVSTLTIDFSASKFDHVPHESEFVIDRAGIHRVIKWRAPNRIAEEIEYFLWDAFGVEIDIEPAVRKTAWTTLIMMGCFAALILALEVRRRKRRG